MFIAILVVLMETNRLVPWLRQSDHPIQRYHALHARAGKYNFPHKVRDLWLNFAIEPFLELTPPVCHFKIGFKWLTSTILQLQVQSFMSKILVCVPLKYQISVIFRNILDHNFTREGHRTKILGAKES